MYEHAIADGPDELGVDHVVVAVADRRRMLFSGLDRSETVVSGIPLVMTERPADAWRRLTWRELAARQGRSLDSSAGPPLLRWFAYRVWPETIQPPCEGSLDRDSFDSLTRILAARSAEGRRTRILAWHAPTSWWGPGNPLVRGVLARIPMFGVYGQPFTPSNVWPGDRSWLVYTDYDLCATKVSGEPALIAELRNCAELETLDCTTSSDGGT